MKARIPLMCAPLLAACLAGCSGARLSHEEARRQIAAIGTSTLVPGSIQIQRIVSQTDKDAIAETTVALAFEFKRDKTSDPWRVAAVRLGDRDWVGVDELIAAINDNRRKVTLQSLQALAKGIAAFQQRNGSLPNAKDIETLTDILHPNYMSVLVRTDAWGHPFLFEITPPGNRLVSFGPDVIRGTADDIQLPASTAP
jgi:hypothetical protein